MLKIHDTPIPIDIEKFELAELTMAMECYQYYCKNVHKDKKVPLAPSAYFTYILSEIVRGGYGGYESIEKLYNDYIDLVGKENFEQSIKDCLLTWERYRNSGRKIETIH